MNYKLKIRISILLCLCLLSLSFQSTILVGAASGDSVPTNVGFWGFDADSEQNILNQGSNTIMCLYDFETEAFILVRCPDHMYYISSGKVVTSEDYSSMSGSSFKDVLKENVVASWGQGRGYFNLNASQLFTCWALGPSGNVVQYQRSNFDGIFNMTSYLNVPRKYDVLRYLYINDQDMYNTCRYGLCWSTQELDWSFSGFGNFISDMQNAIIFTSTGGLSYLTFKGGVSYALSDTDIPTYIFYPGGFNYSVPDPEHDEDEPSPTPVINYFPTVTDVYFTTLTYYTSKQLIIMRFYSESEQKYMIRYFTLFSEKDRSNKIISDPLVTSISENSGIVRVEILNQIAGGFTPHWNEFGSESNLVTYFDSLDQILGTIVSLANHNLSLNSFTKISGDNYYFNYNPGGDYYFEDAILGNINTDGSVSFGESSEPSPTPSSTPTPTPFVPVYNSPTPTPTLAPGVTVIPTQGPTETSVKELRGWKGALQKVLTTVFVGNTDAIAGYFKDAVAGYNIVQNPFKQIVDSIYVDGSDQENFDPFENQQVEFIFDVHDQNGDVLGGEHTANWRLTILPKTFWTWLKSYSNYFEIVFYMVDASFLGATMKRWLTKQNDEGSETKEGGDG